MKGLEKVETVQKRICIGRVAALKAIARIWTLFLIVSSLVAVVCPQRNVLVTRATAETRHSVSFDVSLVRSDINRGDDIVLKYVVTNNGKLPVILLTSTGPADARLVALGVIEVHSAFQFVDDHFPVTYKFVKISSGKHFEGKIIVQPKVYAESKAYSFEDATLKMEFAYMIAEKPPQECADIRWPKPCLYAVSKLAQRTSVGMLVVGIK